MIAYPVEMRKATFVVMLAALVVGMMAIFSVDRLQRQAALLSARPTGPGPEARPAGSLDQLKKDFVQAAGIEISHNDVYARVGEAKWEGEVKPRFLRLIGERVIRETGNPLPSTEDTLEWLRTHRSETQSLLEKAERGE